MISVENTACYGLWGSFSLTYWLCLFFVLRPSRVYFEDVIFAGERLQNLDLSQAPTAFEQGGGDLYRVTHALQQTHRVCFGFFFCGLIHKSAPIRAPFGILKTCSSLGPRGMSTNHRHQSYGPSRLTQLNKCLWYQRSPGRWGCLYSILLHLFCISNSKKGQGYVY